MKMVKIAAVLAICSMSAHANPPNGDDIQAQVAQGIQQAKAAQAAVEKTMKARKQGAVAAYVGTGASAPGSYDFQFTPNDVVTSISITGVPDVQAPTVGDATITITYAPRVAQALMTTVKLQPGSGQISPQVGIPIAAMDAGSPIIWGCRTESSYAPAFKYLPANCRY